MTNIANKELITNISGKIERITYSSNESGYVVLRIRPIKGGGQFTAVGHIPELINNALLEGVEIEFEGQWNLTKYGRQFNFTQYKFLDGDVYFFLSRVVKGVGKELAKTLISKYGEKEIINILDKEPQKLLSVKGIKTKRLQVITNSWQKHKSLKELSNYLNIKTGQITSNMLIKIYNHFGEKAINLIRENPYNLCDIRGVGFKTADKIALSTGLRADSPQRITAAINHLLLEEAENEGHCYQNNEEFLKKITELMTHEEISPKKEDIEKAIGQMSALGNIILGQDEKLGLSSFYYMESWIRNFFEERSLITDRKTIAVSDVENFISQYEERTKFELSHEQKEIIIKIATEGRMLFSLAGYAGTGKTTVCRVILNLLSRYYCKDNDIVCCAFTGMASSRIRKATGFDAFTIHSLLKYQGENKFEHGPENPLPYKIVVLDEASMVNLQIFYRLARSLRPDTLFILVGDPAQLPPIGAGNVFADALEKSLIPSIKLTKIYRQSEDSVLTLFANTIREGIVPEGVNESNWKDFRFENVEPHNLIIAKNKCSEKELKLLREENNMAILNRIRGLAQYYKDKLEHPIWDFQVLTPMRMGQLGTENLNLVLQNILNPLPKTSLKKHGLEIREGDKVVHLQNKDMPCMDWEEYLQSGKNFSGKEFKRIFNGSVGLITKIDTEEDMFYVVYPERIVIAYHADYIGDIIEHAFSLTVHKAQGSQYRVVVIPLTNSHFIMLNNKWFYTAITRAEQKVYLIGQKYALKRACTNIESAERKTWLKGF